MKRQPTLAANIGALLLLTLSTPVLGETISEEGGGKDDANSVITSAQVIDVSSSNLVIAGELYFGVEFVADPPPGMNVYHRDVDFYSFFALAGDELVFDIDGGFGGAVAVDTKLGVFGPGPTYPILAQNDHATVIDPGSDSLRDAFIDKFVVPSDGIYTVIVAGRNTIFLPGGLILGGVNGHLGNGDYLLKISGLSASPATRVDIAISIGKFKKAKKGKKQKVAKINLKKKKVKVAILGSSDFQVSAVDTSTLTFGAIGNEKTLRKCKRRTKDLNRDGEPDLECEFSLRDSGFNKYSYEGVLSGQTSDGSAFSGTYNVKVKGKLKKSKG